MLTGTRVKTNDISPYRGTLLGTCEVIRFGAKTEYGLIDLGMDGGFWSADGQAFVTVLTVALENIQEDHDNY